MVGWGKTSKEADLIWIWQYQQAQVPTSVAKKLRSSKVLKVKEATRALNLHFLQ